MKGSEPAADPATAIASRNRAVRGFIALYSSPVWGLCPQIQSTTTSVIAKNTRLKIPLGFAWAATPVNVPPANARNACLTADCGSIARPLGQMDLVRKYAPNVYGKTIRKSV